MAGDATLRSTHLPLRLCIAIAVLLTVAPGRVEAGELSSASFRLRGAHMSTAAAAVLSAPGPRFSSSGFSFGQSDAVGFSGGTATLSTHAPGFWPIVAGALPTLDVDGDGLAAWRDDDDDGDGLLDAVETHTGVFVSAGDTGSNPADADSDGDGFGDGAEVVAGSNPNEAASIPPAPIPALNGALRLALCLVLCAVPLSLRRKFGGVR